MKGGDGPVLFYFKERQGRGLCDVFRSVFYVCMSDAEGALRCCAGPGKADLEVEFVRCWSMETGEAKRDVW